MPNFKFFKNAGRAGGEIACNLTKKGLAKGVILVDDLLNQPLTMGYVTSNTILSLIMSLTQQISNTNLTIEGNASMEGLNLEANVVASASFAPEGRINVPINISPFSVPLNVTGNVAKFLNINEQLVDDTTHNIMYAMLAINLFHLLRKCFTHWAKQYDKQHQYPKAYATAYVVEQILFGIAISLLPYAVSSEVMYNNTPESNLFSEQDAKRFNESKAGDPPLGFSFLGQSVSINGNGRAAGGVSGSIQGSIARQDDQIAANATRLMIFSSVMLGLAISLRLARVLLSNDRSGSLTRCCPAGAAAQQEDHEMRPRM